MATIYPAAERLARELHIPAADNVEATLSRWEIIYQETFGRMPCVQEREAARSVRTRLSELPPPPPFCGIPAPALILGLDGK